MALTALNGSFLVPIGPTLLGTALFQPATAGMIVDAANEAIIFIGHVVTSDGASHTIDTSGSSALMWRTGSVTFSDGGTTVKAGLAAVLTTAGPPGRAAHASDVITFDVSKSMTGGGGGVTANAWQTHVPDAGSKTIANGDLVAFAVQMTARGGTDTVSITCQDATQALNRPIVTGFQGGSYSAAANVPNCLIRFSDGAYGYFHGTNVFSTINSQVWNSGSATKEYGQLYQLPFPVKVYGLYGWVDPDNDFDAVLYSDPLGTPVAEKTVSVDISTVSSTTGRRFTVTFGSPYAVSARQPIGAVLKPGASSITGYYRTLADAAHRVTDPWGTDGYGISRASGAFANANSSLDHYSIGLLVGALEHGVQPTYALGI